MARVIPLPATIDVAPPSSAPSPASPASPSDAVDIKVLSKLMDGYDWLILIEIQHYIDTIHNRAWCNR
jgi:hypothetical protein